jgi:hypothetical protein
VAKKLPAWAFRHVQKCRDAFGIGHAGFHVCVHLKKCIDDNPDVAGEAYTVARYHRACVTLRRDIRPDDTGYETITHELLHAASGAQRRAVDRIVELLPAEQREFAEALWQDGNEETTTQIARALTPMLRLLEKEE